MSVVLNFCVVISEYGHNDIVDHCCYAWNMLIDQPWKIMSIALDHLEFFFGSDVVALAITLTKQAGQFGYGNFET